MCKGFRFALGDRAFVVMRKLDKDFDVIAQITLRPY